MVLSVILITRTKNVTELCVNYGWEHDDLRMQGRKEARESWDRAIVTIGPIKVPLVLLFLSSDMFTEELLHCAKDPRRVPLKRTHRDGSKINVLFKGH